MSPIVSIVAIFSDFFYLETTPEMRDVFAKILKISQNAGFPHDSGTVDMYVIKRASSVCDQVRHIRTRVLFRNVVNLTRQVTRTRATHRI